MDNNETQDTDANAPTYTLTDLVKGITEALAHFGLAWLTETVNTEPDKTGSVKVVASTDAQILAPVDYDNFVNNFPNAKEILLGIANGTSLRVMSQDVNRRNPGKSAEWRRTAIVNRLAGIRNAGVRTVVTKTVTVEKIVVKYPLPKGGFWEGDTLVEYQQQYLAELVELGASVSLAQTMVANLTLTK